MSLSTLANVAPTRECFAELFVIALAGVCIVSTSRLDLVALIAASGQHLMSGVFFFLSGLPCCGPYR